MTALFKRDPETLDGYKPKFSKVETLLGYEYDRYQVRGLGIFTEDDQDPQFHESHSITVLGHKIFGYGSFSLMNRYDIVASIANQFLSNKQNAVKFKEQYEYLQQNAVDLNNSKRYWLAVEHLERIKRTKDKIKDLQAEVKREEINASVNAVGVKQERNLSISERQLLIAEFSGGEEE